jgi:hypothetical protein
MADVTRTPFLHQSVMQLVDEFLPLASGICDVVNRSLGSETLVSDVQVEAWRFHLTANARAMRKGNRGTIALNTGLVLALFDASNAVAHGSEALSALVEGEISAIARDRPRGWLSDYSALIGSSPETAKFWEAQYAASLLTPRAGMALFLFDACITWFVCHEVSHILLDHHGMLASGSLPEMGPCKLTCLGVNEKPMGRRCFPIGALHALELEADSLASQMTLKVMEDVFSGERYFSPLTGIDALDYRGDWPNPTSELFERLMLCVPLIVGSLFASAAQDFSLWTERHPSAHLRYRLLEARIKERVGPTDWSRLKSEAKADEGKIKKLLYAGSKAASITSTDGELDAISSITTQIFERWGSLDDRYMRGRSKTAGTSQIFQLDDESLARMLL